MHACVRAHTHAYTHKHTHTHAHTYACTHARTYTCMHARTHTHTHTHTRTRTHTHTHTLSHTHCNEGNERGKERRDTPARTHTHLHTHTHTHTHTHNYCNDGNKKIPSWLCGHVLQVFWVWIGNSILHSVFLFWFPLLMLEKGKTDRGRQAEARHSSCCLAPRCLLRGLVSARDRLLFIGVFLCAFFLHFILIHITPKFVITIFLFASNAGVIFLVHVVLWPQTLCLLPLQSWCSQYM